MLDNLLIWDNFNGCDQIFKKKKKIVPSPVLVKELPVTRRKSVLWKYGIPGELTHSAAAVKSERQIVQVVAELSVPWIGEKSVN